MIENSFQDSLPRSEKHILPLYTVQTHMQWSANDKSMPITPHDPNLCQSTRYSLSH